MTGRLVRRVPVVDVLLIVFSVFIAVALEGWWDQRSRADDARVVLAQALEELVQDRSDLDEVLAEQDARGGQYRDLERWLGDPGSMPLDSVGAALDSLAWSNRTLWTRRAGWTTMVAGNQLALLRAPELVAALGNHHENLNVRLRANSDNYARAVNHFVFETLPTRWDPQNHVLLTDDGPTLAALRSELHLLHYSWNQWYRSYLRQYLESLDSVIATLASYLEP
jgi:hypothetical protein